MIYFDQFGYLSTLHLLLVILGIVVLLTGVWIVSFPPGGQQGGIDVGTWGEEDECDEAHDEHNETLSRYEDEPLPMDSSHVVQDEAIGMGRMSSQESSRRPISVDTRPSERGTEDADTSSSPTSRAAHLRRQTEPALLSPHHQTDDLPETPTSPTGTTARRHPMPPHHSTLGHHHLTSPRQSFPSHPLSPGAPSGFSIGLSPVSPGFALIPRERGRRRRVTSVEGDAHVLEHGTLRRVFSDSGNAHEDSNEGRGEGGEQVASPRTERDIEASGLHVGGDNSRQRWRWLSGLFTRKPQTDS